MRGVTTISPSNGPDRVEFSMPGSGEVVSIICKDSFVSRIVRAVLQSDHSGCIPDAHRVARELNELRQRWTEK